MRRDAVREREALRPEPSELELREPREALVAVAAALQSRLKLIQYTEIVGKDNNMSERSRVAEFVSFCVEAYANAKGMSGSDVFRLFDSCGLVRYLDEGYDVLHTQ